MGLKSAKESRDIIVKVYSEHRYTMVTEHPNLHMKIDEACARGERWIVYFEKRLNVLDINTLKWLDYGVEDMKNGTYKIKW